MEGFCSDDSFWYFQPWLVGLGRDTFETVAADPDALADVAQIRYLTGRARSAWSDDEWPEWELLNYVALNAHQLATGQDDEFDDALEASGLDRVCDAHPETPPASGSRRRDRPGRCSRPDGMVIGARGVTRG
jgi:Protein of unknown function (DUF4240)